MDIDFWIERWQKGEIGFHQSQVNPYLLDHWHRLGVKPGGRVFVPLCGKSLDILWFRSQGYEVIGVEASERAIIDFGQENGLIYKKSSTDVYTIYQAQGITLLLGDYFKLTPAVLGNISAVYDRAALVAMPADRRLQYVQHMAGLLEKGCKILLVTLEYPEHEIGGPPFSVTENELYQLCEKLFLVEQLDSNPGALDTNPRFRERGVSQLEEKTWILKRL